MADHGIVWNGHQQRDTLAAIEIVTSHCKGDKPALTNATVRFLEELGIEEVLAGYNNLCNILIKDAAERMGVDKMDVLYSLNKQVKSIKIVG